MVNVRPEDGARAGRDTDICLDMLLMAKARKESSDPTPFKKKAGD